MRCDIGRIAILHAHSRFYADLDVAPNREWYALAQLAAHAGHVVQDQQIYHKYKMPAGEAPTATRGRLKQLAGIGAADPPGRSQ